MFVITTCKYVHQEITIAAVLVHGNSLDTGCESGAIYRHGNKVFGCIIYHQILFSCLTLQTIFLPYKCHVDKKFLFLKENWC